MAGPPPPPSAAFLVMALGRRVAAAVDAELAGHGIAMRHFSALGHLSREPGLSYSELARRAGVTPQSMQATLRQLETLGAVERLTEAGRGRTAELRVTDHGRSLIETGRTAIDRADEELFTTDRELLTRALFQAFTRGEA